MTRHTTRTTDDERLSDTVLDAVATATGSDPEGLPRFARLIDLDALDRLYRHHEENDGVCSRIEFVVADCDVRVHTDGRVVVVPPEPDRRRASS